VEEVGGMVGCTAATVKYLHASYVAQKIVSHNVRVSGSNYVSLDNVTAIDKISTVKNVSFDTYYHICGTTIVSNHS
jgi:hypothetical protein